ncbi:MAG: glycine zipper 2TM domain-containing protein [Rhizobacter sp.]|nr:glycine zipper 2TM domain-containing protein [Rhizobacter sp.]
MTAVTPPPQDHASPGAVPRQSANPIVWWVAGGLGVLGAGALAAALVSAPHTDTAPPVASAEKVAAGKPTPAAKVPKAKPTPAPATAAVPVCASCGTVEHVTAEKHKGEGTGLGAVGGAVVGGVIGHQMGGGNGKKALTVLGAVGGGLAGHEIEKQARSSTVYKVQLHMDDGSTRTLTQASAPAVGARVEVQGNELKPLPAKG